MSVHAPPATERQDGVRWALGALALAALVRLALAWGTDLYFDEAYYAAWARRLALGYYDHPPLTAWLIALLGVRPAALLCGAATVAVVGRLARDVYQSPAAGWRAAALYAWVPVANLAGVFTTPDTPLLLFWALALWALWHERFAWAGVACGLALLGKYPAVLLGVAYLGAAARARRLPGGAWVTAGLALLCFAPVVLWNARHGWAGFGFQLRHGLGGTGGWKSLGEYLLGQLAMGGPVVAVWALVWAVRGERRLLLLRLAALVPLLAFGWAAFRTRGEANWPAAAYVAACVGLGGAWGRWGKAALATGALVVLAVASHLLVPLVRPRRDVALARVHGWSELARLPALTSGPAPVAVFAPSYQLASQALLYAGLPAGTVRARYSQYDLWGAPPVPRGASALYLTEGAEPPPPELAERFERLEGPVLLPADYRGRRVHTFRVWRLEAAR